MAVNVGEYTEDSIKSLVVRPLGEVATRQGKYFNDDLVMAFQFGYPKNRNFSKIGNYLTRPVLLFSTIEVPNGHGLKMSLLWANFALFLFVPTWVFRRKVKFSKKKSSH